MTPPLAKLLVSGINELVARGLISLSPTDDENNFGHILIDIAGRPSALMWRDIGCGELRISVWFDLDISRHPQATMEGDCGEHFLTARPLAKRHRYPEFVGATASCYLERERGPRVQGVGREATFQTYVRRDMRPILAAIPDPIPMGFVMSGRSHA